MIGEFEDTTQRAAFESFVTIIDDASDRALMRISCFEQNGIAEAFPLFSVRHPPLKKDFTSSAEQSGSQQQFGSHAFRVRSQRQVPKSWFKLDIDGVGVVETEFYGGIG